MNLLKKYMLLFFLIANATAEYIALSSASDILFYAVLALGSVMMVTSNGFSRMYRDQCKDMYVLIGIYIIAQVLQFDVCTISKVLYTISKVVVLCTIVYCVSNNFDYYSRDIIIPMSYIIVVLVAVGWVHNRDVYDERGEFVQMVFGFANRNAACTLSSIGYAGFLFMRDKLRKTDYICIAVLLYTVLVGGSRNALAMCVLITMVRYGVSARMMLLSFIAVATMLFVSKLIGLEFDTIDRLTGTINGTVAIDRENQREAGLWMAAQRPCTGWGYNQENFGYAAQLTEFGPHNGYISSLKNLGYPLGVLFICTIIVGSLRRFKIYFQKNRVLNFHLAVLVSVLFAAYQEDYLIGVNQVTTNVFFLSFTVLGIWIKRSNILSQS